MDFARSTVRSVDFAQIDLDDTRFQHRLTVTTQGLDQSLRREGQLSPIVLLGGGPRYRIVDGFRRAEAGRKLGWNSIRALVRDDLDEEAAFALSFVQNVARKNFSALDKANAIWRALNERGLSRADTCEAFGLSDRQLTRYIGLLDLDETLRSAVVAETISMAHAAVIHNAPDADSKQCVSWVRDEGLSVDHLKRRLQPRRRAGRRRKYMVRSGSGFRCYGFQYHARLPADEKRRIREALQLALSILEE